MDDFIFANLSQIEILRKMSVICQTSADETISGAERERLQIASNQLRDEADKLAIQGLEDNLGQTQSGNAL